MGNLDSKEENINRSGSATSARSPTLVTGSARSETTFSSLSQGQASFSNPGNSGVNNTNRINTNNPDVGAAWEALVLEHRGRSSTDANTKMANKGDITNKLQQLSINGNKDINILLLGETGVGKSTFINSIFNYLQHQTFEKAEKEELNVLIPSGFTVYDKDDKPRFIEVGSREDKNEFLNVGSSATQSVKTYTFYINNGKTMVRLIDTPGIGDTRGPEQDDINCENILNYISRIHQLHAICYLFKPQHSRATAFFKYCVSQILSRLEKSACNNIVFVFTHSQGNPGETYQLLKQISEEVSKMPAQAKIPIENNQFCFDNEAFTHLAAIKNGIQLKESTKRSVIDNWTKSTDQCWKLIDYILDLNPHFVKHTAAINEARRIIYQLAQPMADIAQLINDNIHVLQNHESHLDLDRKSLGELKKKLFIPVIDLEVTNLTQPVTVCTDLKCTEVYMVGERKEWHYKTRCHDPCYLTNVPKDLMGSPELINCASMDGNQICKQCGHSYKVHMHVYYMTKKKQTEIKDDNVLKSINTKELVIENVLKIIADVKQRKTKLEKELNVIVKCNAKFAHFLQNNAIAPFSDSYAEYIHHVIVKEKGLGSNADINKMAGLERLLRLHNEMKKIFSEAAAMQKKLGKNDEVTPQDISSSMQELFKLNLNGKKIRELYNSQKTSINKEHHFSEYVHKGTFAQAAPSPAKDQSKDQNKGQSKEQNKGQSKDQNKGKSSATNPTTKFQRGRPTNRGNQNMQRGRGYGPHHRNRTPPPPYDSAHPNQGYPPAGPPQGYPGYSQAPYPPPPPPQGPYSPQPPVASKIDEKPSTIQVNVTLPTPVGEKRDDPNYPPRDPRDPYPDRYRDYPRDYPPRDYPPRDYGDYHPRSPDYPPRDPNYPPRDANYPPRDPHYPSSDPHYPPRDPYYPPRDPHYPPRDPHYPPRDPHYPPRDPHYPPRDPHYPPRDPHYPPRDPNYPPRDPYYPPRDPHYPPRTDYPPRPAYPPRDPQYDPRYPASSSQYPPPPPPEPNRNNPRPGNYQQNFHQNRGGNFRGRGNQNRGGINRRYRKKQDNANADANSGDDSDTSVASSKK